MNLHNKKMHLLEIMTNKYNSNELEVDLGLMEEFEELRKKI